MRVFINDEPREVSAGLTVSDLLSDLGLVSFNGLALAVNNMVIVRAHWAERLLADDDKVLIIRATKGG